MEFTNPYATQLIVGNTAGTFLEVGPAAIGGAGQDVAALRLRTGAATPTLDLLSIFYDDFLGAAQIHGGGTAHSLQVRADGHVSIYSRKPSAGYADFPGVTLLAVDNAVDVAPQKSAQLQLYPGDGLGAHARIAAQVNDNDGRGTQGGVVPIALGATRQLYAQAGQVTSNYPAAGWPIVYPAPFPTATLAVAGMWVNSGGAWCSAYGLDRTGFHLQVFYGGAEWAAGSPVGAGATWMAWGY